LHLGTALELQGLEMKAIATLETTLRAQLRGFLPRAPESFCERHVVVLLHGWAGWSRMLLSLEQHLAARLGRRVVRAQVGRGLDCIRSCAKRANAAIDRLAAGGRLETVDIVGHSMGGLVATELLKSLDRGRRIRSVITLGTPHRGSPLARLGARLLRGWSGSLEQMLPEADFLRALGARPLPRGTALYSVSGTSDLLVPPRYASLPRRAGCHNVVLLGADHWGLALHPSAHQLVERLLRRERVERGHLPTCDRCEQEPPAGAASAVDAGRRSCGLAIAEM
jgi:pimeloyl-ACP methyl ester carboxylesterase